MRRLLFLLALITLCCRQPVSAGEKKLDRARIHDLFSEAKTLFRQANETDDESAARSLYLRSALRYEGIVKAGGIRNGGLYYNLGNAWFRHGDLGKAILNYRRAEKYIPTDSNLQQNLRYARHRRMDRIEEKENTRLLKVILFWHYDLSSRTRHLVFAVSFLLFWLGVAVRTLARRYPPRGILGLTLFVAIVFLASITTTNFFATEEGVIVEAEVVARKGDGDSYQPSFKEALHAGTEFNLMEKRAEWLQIELRDGNHCWVPAKATELIGD